MPNLPRSQCATPRCKEASIRGSIHCQGHTPNKLTDAPSRADLGRYKAKSWQSIRRAQLSRQPLCAACLLEQRTTAAAAVDHVWPWRQLSVDAFIRNRFQSLCVAHHSVKTGLEMRGICREYRPMGVRDWTLGDWVAQCSS